MKQLDPLIHKAGVANTAAHTAAKGASVPTAPPYAPARRKPQKAEPSHNWLELYLAELEKCGVQKMAAAVAFFSISGIRNRRRIDPAFASAEREARAGFRDIAVGEAIRRGVHGTEEVIVTGHGKNRREVRRTVYSDTLLLRVLEYQESGSFRQRQQVKHSGGIASLPTLEANWRYLEAKKAIAEDKAAGLATLPAQADAGA